MKQLVIIENDPNEYGTHECHPLGYRLVEYLPVEWKPIESGAQEQGVHIVGETAKGSENLTSEEIRERIKSKLSELSKGFKLIDLHELSFQILLCDFLTLCNKYRHLYTENNFIHIMGVNGFNIPQFRYRAFDTYKKEEVTAYAFMPTNLYNVEDMLNDIKDSPYLFAREYTCNTDIDYYISVVLEIIKQGKFIKQCEHCERWFVTDKKSDEKYCKRISPYNEKKTCAQVMRAVKERQRIKNNLVVWAKEQARNRANSRETYHPGAAAEFKLLVSEWERLYKNGQISEEEYIEKLNACMRSDKRDKNI